MLYTKHPMNHDDYTQYCKDMRGRREKYPKKFHTLGKFNYNDVAIAAGVSYRTLNRRIKAAGISDLSRLSLKELISFIGSIRKESVDLVEI